jgi:hypothetical protein
MAPKKKKAPAKNTTPPVTTGYAAAVGNMYSGMGSSQLPTVDSRAALNKLTSGGTLTPEERKILNLSPIVTPSVTPDTTPDTKPSGTPDVTPPSGGGEPPKEITLVSTAQDSYGNTIGFFSDGTSKQLLASGNKFGSTVDLDAYALLTQTFKDYDLEGFDKVVQGYMDAGLGPEQATLEIKTNPIYTARFKGNETRRNAGLNVLSEAEYLDLESSYMQTLKSYGLANELGADKTTRRAAMANIIGNDIAATEFKERIDTVVSRVKNADSGVKATMSAFFGIKEEDLVSYFINPKENLPKLQEKVTAAEIGAAATGQGLATNEQAATALARFGVTQEQARQGYSAIGDVLPTASKLGEIYGDRYTQDIAEQEVFKGSASAKRKREQLAQREAASFAGSSGRLRTGQMQGNTGSF